MKTIDDVKNIKLLFQVGLCLPLFHRSLIWRCCLPAHLWPPSISSYLDKKLLSSTLIKHLLTNWYCLNLNLKASIRYKIAFAWKKIRTTHSTPQIATDPTVSTADYYVRKMLSGVDFHTSKPLLAAEMRRIVPTAAGLPMEINLYTSAVAAATVQGGMKLENIDLADKISSYSEHWHLNSFFPPQSRLPQHQFCSKNSVLHICSSKIFTLRLK